MNDPTAAADIAETNRAFEAMREYGIRTLEQSDVNLVVAEYQRMREKLDAISEGKTILLMNDDDRAKAAHELDDATLAAWARATLIQLHAIHDRRNPDPAEKLMAMHGVIALALSAKKFGAGSIKFAVSGVTYKGDEQGDWEVIVREQGPTDAEKALHLFREFYERNVTQSRDGSSGHPIWGLVAEALDEAGLNHTTIESGHLWRFIQPGNRETLDALDAASRAHPADPWGPVADL